jgi:SpoVK/Ycf46/Vps4 family AAA+-type ATPase
MGATNRPFDLDLAVLRRLPHRILVDLPGKQARLSIISKILANVALDASTLPADSRTDATDEAGKKAFVDKVATLTEGYSGSDLHNLCSTAANMIVRDILNDKDYNPDAPLELVEGIALKHASRALTFQDFERALQEVKPSVDDNDRSITMLRTWQKSFGQVKRTTIGF